jgi:phosphoserine phosphatase RsbU/P
MCSLAVRDIPFKTARPMTGLLGNQAVIVPVPMRDPGVIYLDDPAPHRVPVARRVLDATRHEPRTTPPTVVSRIDNLSLAGHCIPAGVRGEPIAGDFFDAFPLSGSQVLIALGDVAGHGVGAARRMTLLRAATRRFATDELSPAQVLRDLDEMQICGDADDIATLWLGMYDPATGMLRYASAGHPPPVLAGIAGPPRLLSEATAPPLGTGVVGQHATVDEIQLPVNALLVAYSDGLVERRGCNLDDQLALLRALVERAYDPSLPDATPENLVETILNVLVPDPATARDDVCILVVRREA